MVNFSQKVLRRIEKIALSITPSNFSNNLFISFLHRKTAREDLFYTTHKRPKKAVDVQIKIVQSPLPRIAIILQGPIMVDQDFTLETAKLYKKFWPGAILILSTWKDEDLITLDAIKKNGWHVIENDKPVFAGHRNINFQLTSTLSGMNLAKTLGATYVIKTRIDQRIYNPNVLQLFAHLDRMYPPNTNTEQTRRLFLPNIDTAKYRPYGVGDMLMFGHIDDMLTYWGAKHDDRIIPVKDYTILELAKERTVEGYLGTEYLMTMGENLTYTLDDSWKMFGKYFCVFEHNLLDLFWYKYDVHTEFRFHHYNKTHAHEVMTFAEWTMCYEESYDPATLPEEILHIKDGTSL